MEGIPFIGQDGFYPPWAKGSARWLFQRTLVSVGGMMSGLAELVAARVPAAQQIIVWVPPRRRIFDSRSLTSIHTERQRALSQLSTFSLRCYGKECDLKLGNFHAVCTVVQENGLKPEQWYLMCPNCGGIVGPDLAPVNATGIIRRWNKVGKPALENPAASAVFKSAPAISDVPTWIQTSDPSHLELAYLGQQMWRSIDVMFQGLGTYARQAQAPAATGDT
jgi:hypothetical protein